MLKGKYKINSRLVGLVLANSISLLSGCISVEMSGSNDNVDIIDTNSLTSDSLVNGVRQVLDVNGENFKLIVEYNCDNSKWLITENKNLYMSIYTEGLDSNKEVYIDNIHMDTSIVSTKAKFNGIKQDTLDDRIHNSLMIGFPISDTNVYFGINEIEGQNNEFIEGFTYGYNGYSAGSISTQRHTESDFLEQGVWANKIDGAIGLLIKDKTTGDIRGVDVQTDLMVTINNCVTFKEDDKLITYQYDKEGNKTVVKEEEISKQLVK